jgi:cobalt-zinc-cadmium efflux system outer membrane protein
MKACITTLNAMLPSIERRRLLPCLLAAIAAGGFAARARAQDPAAAGTEVESARDADKVWTLPELSDELKRSNPQLEQAHEAYLAAKLQVPQVTALPAPQLSLLEQANTGGPFDFKSSSDFFAYPSFTQPFLWPGKRGVAGEVASAQAEVIGRQYDTLVIQLVAQLQLNFYQLIALQSQRHFMDEDLQRLQQMQEVAKVRYANNAAAFVDFLNAQVAVGSLRNDRFGIDKQIQSAEEQINTLVGHASQTVLAVRDAASAPHLPTQSLADLIALARRTNPRMAADASQLQAADKSLALAEKTFFPDFALSVGAYTDPALDRPDSTRLYSVGVSVTLPTWGYQKEHAAVGQARVQIKVARAAQSADMQLLDLAVANAYHSLETSLQQVKFNRERLLPQAQMAYRLALAGYGSNGGTAFAELLTVQSSLRAAELSLLQAQNAARQAYVSLSAAIAREPD